VGGFWEGANARRLEPTGMENVIRWGILGCGDVAEKKSGPALYQANGSRLVAVMRRDRAKAEDFARRHGADRAYDREEDLLADPDVDAVYIATPPFLHAPQTIRAARAGKRVLVEKPMALNGTECDQMIAACQSAGVSLHVAYYRRFYPKFQAAQKLLAGGAVGRVLGARLLMQARNGGGGWRVDPQKSGGGHFVDVGSHRLDMLVHLLGDVTDVCGFAENAPALHSCENDVAFALRFASKTVASGSFHFRTGPARDVLEIYGDAGTMTFDPFDGETFTVRALNGEATEHRHTTPLPVHLPFIQTLVDGYQGRTNGEAHVTGEEGAKATRIMEAILSS